MDVQNSVNAFSRLNELSLPAGTLRGGSWADTLNLQDASTANPAAPSQFSPSHKAFPDALNRAVANQPDQSDAAAADPTQAGQSPKDAEFRKWATMLVNKFFLGTMLKQMRDSPFKNEMFTGGRAGEAYQGMMDQKLTEGAGSKLAKSLVDSMVKRHSQNADSQRLFTDPAQQKQLDTYNQTKTKRVSHDSATTLSA